MTLALLLALLRVASGTTLEGVVRSSDDNAPVVAAQVEVTTAGVSNPYARVYTDTAGSYAIVELPPGSYHVRVTSAGFDPREMDVFIAASQPVRVDVVLAPHPVRLAEILVSAAALRAARDDSAAASLADRDVGAVVLAGDALHADPSLASADALQSLALRSGAAMRSDAPTSMHVDGAAAGENAVLLDGIPLFNPSHSSGTLTAIDPDIISSATLHSGTMSAALGDATGSVTELEAVAPESKRLTMQGGYSARTFRQSLSGPLTTGGGSFLFAIRRSQDASLSDPHDRASSGMAFGDLFARVTTSLGGGELEAFALHGDDRLGFDAGSGSRAANEELPQLAGASPIVPNALTWTTGTDAVRWRTSGPTSWDLRAWRTHFDASAGWAGSTHLASALEDLGASASAGWQPGGVHFDAGVAANRLDVRYRVSTTIDSVGAPLSLAGAPLVVSAFGDARWSAGDQWTFAAGVRDAIVAPGDHGIEPRLSMRYAPSRRVSLGLGYSKLHQYVQSMRNEESLVDALAGISLPAVAGSTAAGETVPVARADQLTASLDARLSSTLALSTVAYTRSEQGLVMVAPVSGEPFATTAFATGSARAQGITIALARAGERVTGNLAYTISSVSRRAGSDAYVPDFAASQSLALGVGVRVGSSTTLRLAASANSGSPASVFAGRIEWTPYTPSSGRGDLSGSPQRIVGALNGAQLPAYVRVDVGVRREWGLRVFGHTAQIAGDAAITNVFGRANTLGLIAAPGGSPLQPLFLPARGLDLGIEWKR